MIKFALDVVAPLATTMTKNPVYGRECLIRSTWREGDHRSSVPIRNTKQNIWLRLNNKSYLAFHLYQIVDD